MKNALVNLLEQLKKTSLGAKVTSVGVLALVAVLSVVAIVWSSQPHYTTLLTGLDDSEIASVGEALAGAGVKWKATQPPGPFVVYVDESQMASARNAVFAAGALKGHSGGILTESSGLSTLLLGSQEREQIMHKRVWEEMEQMLELQEFIVDAKVQTRIPDRRVYGRQPELSASVTLVTRGGRELTRTQARTVARLVRFGLGVEEENLVIADDLGKSVFDGHDLASGTGMADDWIASAEDADHRLELKATELLDDILGDGLARVTIRSDWDFTRSTTIADTTDATGAAVVSEKERTSTDPRFGNSSVGGAAGTASNLSQGTSSQSAFEKTNAGPVAAVEPPVAKQSEKERVLQPSRTLRSTEQRAPLLERLSVALYIDASIDASVIPSIEEAVKASVGFSDARKDEFRTAHIAFAKPELAPDGTPIAPEGGTSLPPIVEKLLDRAIEIVLGIVFLFMTLRSFRGASKARKERERALSEASERRAVGPDGEPQRSVVVRTNEKGETVTVVIDGDNEEIVPEDPLVTNRRRVSSLVGEEPDKVGDLLTAWVRDSRRISSN
ncbi:MAG: flagellar M-ring protein FliF C-terminal domain-containing protein [Planctomycetota bacterium]